MRALAVIVGISLILAAAGFAGNMLSSGEPFEPFVLCALALLGFGIFGLGLFVPVSLVQPDQCTIDHSADSDGGVETADE